MPKPLSYIEIALLSLPHINHAPNAIPILHIRKGLVDAIERLSVCDELIDLQLAGHVVVHEVWELRTAFDAPESAAFPDAAGNELEC